ncbi:MAG: hypothetical protein Q7J98_07310 [Kiritimatiellia bacterium]|nr:hypothetical protein [Kiritimatiellia bacterium]
MKEYERDSTVCDFALLNPGPPATLNRDFNFVGAFVRPISACRKVEQKITGKARNAFMPLFARLKCVPEGFKTGAGEGN